MQVKFAYAALSITRGGEASIGVAAWAAAASVKETAAIVTLEQTVLSTVRSAPFDQHNENKMQAASRGSRPARPVRPPRSVPMRTAVLATLPTRIGRAPPSACRYGGRFLASVFAFGAADAAPGAKKCADSIETPKTLKAMSTACASARQGPIALCVPSGSQEGAITLHDFKDSLRAVLDVVKV